MYPSGVLGIGVAAYHGLSPEAIIGEPLPGPGMLYLALAANRSQIPHL
ncbi:MAG: hypothetical protein ACP5E3_00745 [Bacteroidales bacterium]